MVKHIAKGLVLALLSSPALSGGFGYIVKVAGDTVYVNPESMESAPAINREFTVFIEGEELFDPVAKKSLGKIIKTIGEGSVSEVAEKYFIGKIKTKSGEIKEKQFVKWSEIKKEYMPAAAVAAKTEPSIWKSASLDGVCAASDVGDINGDGKDEIITARDIDGKKTISVFAFDGSDKLSETAAVEIKGAVKIASLDIVDAKNEGNPQIYAVMFDRMRNSFSTEIFAYSDQGLKKTGELGYIATAAYVNGDKKLFGQTAQTAGGNYFSRVKEVNFEDGKLSLGDYAHKSVKWIYGFALADVNNDGKMDFMSAAKSGRLLLKGGDKKLSLYSDTKFGGAPNRARVNGQELSFYPRIISQKMDENGTVFFAVENIAKNFPLAAAFGQYTSSALHKLVYQDGALKEERIAELPGFVSDISPGAFGGFDKALIAPVNTADGRFSVYAVKI